MQHVQSTELITSCPYHGKQSTNDILFRAKYVPTAET